jgi:AcrR family transcriptional regulator
MREGVRPLLNDPTKARLIEAAGEEFAAKGFDGATIRSISHRAGTNVAAVNYHFGDKESLYAAALLAAHKSGQEEGDETAEADVAPVEMIRRFIHRFLKNLEREAAGSWQTAMMHRELVEPSKASDILVRESIRPRFERLCAAIKCLCPDADELRVHALAFSIVAQCLHYKVACPISVRLIGEEKYSRLDTEYLTEHITNFCLAGMGVALPSDGTPQAAVAKARK